MDMVPDTFPSLFVGYTVIWLLISALVWNSFRRVRHLEEEVRRLKGLQSHSDRAP